MSLDNEDLSLWFGLSYASFAVIPRVIMEDMPQAWQRKMAKLLNELDDRYPNAPPIGYAVRATDMYGKLIKMPGGLINYRHPDPEWLRSLRGEQPTKDETK